MGESLSRSISPKSDGVSYQCPRYRRAPVSEIMVARSDIVALSTTDDFETNMDRIDGMPYVRFPLIEDSVDSFIGVVYAPTVLHNIGMLYSAHTTLEVLATPPLTVAANTTISDFIDRCQAENQELALADADDDIVGLRDCDRRVRGR